jgi:hypothetical protein
MSLSPEEAGCPIRDDSWPRWFKMRDGSVIWFFQVVGWDGEWIVIDEDESAGWDIGEGETVVHDWIDTKLPLRATSIRWSEVVAHGEVQG